MVIVALWLQVLKTAAPPIWAENWRNFLVMRVERWLPGDEGILAAGMLWGGSESLSRQTKEAYRRVGLLHIVAASGYNVTLVTGWILSACLIWLSRRWAPGGDYCGGSNLYVDCRVAGVDYTCGNYEHPGDGGFDSGARKRC